MATRFAWLGLLAALAPQSLWAACTNSQQDQANSGICVTDIVSYLNTGGPQPNIRLKVYWTSNVASDTYNVRLSESQLVGGSLQFVDQPQAQIGGGPTGLWVSSSYPYQPGFNGPPYLIKIQWCLTAPEILGIRISGSDCGVWSETQYTPPPTPPCAPGSGFLCLPPPAPAPQGLVSARVGSDIALNWAIPDGTFLLQATVARAPALGGGVVTLAPPNDAAYLDVNVFPGLYQYTVCLAYQPGVYQADQACANVSGEMPFPFLPGG